GSTFRPAPAPSLLSTKPATSRSWPRMASTGASISSRTRGRNMRGALRVSVLSVSLWCSFAGAGPARAQSFGPPVQADVILQFFDRQGHARFTLATYYALWENAFRVSITTVSPALIFQPVSGPFL